MPRDYTAPAIRTHRCIVQVVPVSHTTMRKKVTIKTAKKKKSQPTVANVTRQVSRMTVKKATPFATAGGIAGRALGSFFGAPTTGGVIGDWLGSGIGRLLGSGSYKLKSNSLFQTPDQVPIMHSGSESIRLTHREYLTDIVGSTGFASTTYSVNPGVFATFPYLSAIANQFEEYKMKGLIFEYKSTSADALNSTNTALGTVAMAAQYRADANVFTSKNDILNHFWSTDTKPSESVVLPIECAPAEAPMSTLYVRANALQANQDTKFYDLAKVTVATSGMQAAATIGELWVSYDIELHKPVSTGQLLPWASSLLYSTSSVSAGFIFGVPARIYDNNPVTFGALSINLPAGREGTFTMQWTASGFTTITGSFGVTYTNATGLGGVSQTVANSSATFYLAYTVINPSLPVTLTFTMPATVTGNGAGSFSINQVNAGIAI